MDIRRVQDVSLDDITLRTNYYSYWQSGNISSAKNLINNNPQLRGKVLDSETLNQFVNSVLGLEENYFVDFEDVLREDREIFQLKIDDLVYVGIYDGINILYKKDNFVIYNEELYFCIKDNPTVGILPTDTEYWLYLGSKGETGTVPLGVKFLGTWNPEIIYYTKDMVLYDNKLYVAIDSSLGAVPTDDTKWMVGVDNEPQHIYVSETEPENLQYGSIWLKIVP